MFSMAESEVNGMEGFLCPICKVDLLDPDQLLAHFEDLHAEQDFYKSLFKDLFGKAKKKLLKQNGSPEKLSQTQRLGYNLSFDYQQNQEIGWSVDHKDLFRMLREERVARLAVPTNQLIIRLNKLLDNIPSDLVKKKAWEQSVVSWVDGTTVTRCPDCAGHFHLARRKHHCRTCGGIMCNTCSHFLPLNTARRIVDKEVEPTQNSTELHLRLCVHCISMLESRERKRELTESCPILAQIYQLLIEARTEAHQHLTSYLTMYHSLDAGESEYNLKDAQLLRVRLIKLAESIDSISEKMRQIGLKEEGTVEEKLCNSVRTAATSFLCNRLLSLPNLPTEEQLKAKQRMRSVEMLEELERKRQREGEWKQQSSLTHSSSNGDTTPPEQQVVSVGEGWVPIERKKTVNEGDDPLIQQMNIIRSYIKQAQLANRLDEVASLEQNLQELKKEVWRKQSAQDDVSREEGSELNYSDQSLSQTD